MFKKNNELDPVGILRKLADRLSGSEDANAILLTKRDVADMLTDIANRLDGTKPPLAP
jgi:hypothetical protein